MKLFVLIPLVLNLIGAELILDPKSQSYQNATTAQQTQGTTGQPQQEIQEKKVVNNISEITALLTKQYNNLLMRPTSNPSTLPTPPDGLKDALKQYHSELLNFYRKNALISSANSSKSNIDNGLNNTINGYENIVKEGDFNSIDGNTNTVNGSFNHIQGHNDFVQGSDNVVISDPETVASMTKGLEEIMKNNGFGNEVLRDQTSRKEKEISVDNASQVKSQPVQEQLVVTPVHTKPESIDEANKTLNVKEGELSNLESSQNGHLTNNIDQNPEQLAEQQSSSSLEQTSTVTPPKQPESNSTVATNGTNAGVSTKYEPYFITGVILLLAMLL